jgi:hypothetical protein
MACIRATWRKVADEFPDTTARRPRGMDSSLSSEPSKFNQPALVGGKASIARPERQCDQWYVLCMRGQLHEAVGNASAMASGGRLAQHVHPSPIARALCDGGLVNQANRMRDLQLQHARDLHRASVSADGPPDSLKRRTKNAQRHRQLSCHGSKKITNTKID